MTEADKRQQLENLEFLLERGGGNTKLNTHQLIALVNTILYIKRTPVEQLTYEAIQTSLNDLRQ